MSENPYLSGNFAPIDEERTAFDLEVTGSIPRELSGRLLRIGPNPIDPRPETHHWFVGNGMVHGVRIRDGGAEWYRNRYVRDDEVVAAKGWPPVAGPRQENEFGSGVANTNVIEHAGRIFAIVEAGNFPVELDDELETIGRSDFDGTLHGSFTAHPKRDPDTGELHAATYSPFSEDLQYLVVGTDGRVRRTVSIPLPDKPMVHDCAITERFFIVLDMPCTFNPQALMDGYPLPYRWAPDRHARVGLLPRDGKADEIQWHEVAPCYVYHLMNAYEDGDGRVVLDVVRHPKMFETDLRGPNEGPSTMNRWTLDPSGGPVKEERLDDRGQEFPRIDERRIGKPYRYGYSTVLDGLDFGSMLKYDLRQGRVEAHEPGAGRFFLEPIFVPASEDAGEDEGWILNYVYDAGEDTSEVLILHAQDFTGKPLARIHLPGRVPFGFHGNWLPDAS